MSLVRLLFLFVRTQIKLFYGEVWSSILCKDSQKLIQCWLELVSESKLNPVPVGLQALHTRVHTY